jgi:TIGR03009 family protein
MLRQTRSDTLIGADPQLRQTLIQGSNISLAMKHRHTLSTLLVGIVFSVASSNGLGQTQQPAGRSAYTPQQGARQPQGPQSPQVNRQPQAPQQLPVTTGQPVKPAGVNPALANVPILQPTWFPLSPQHQAYLDQILGFWEHKSTKTERYRCTFRRWEYDPVFGPKDTYKTFSEGVIKYSAPDKGLFRIDRQFEYRAPKAAGEQATHEEQKGDANSFEHWICDGQFVYQFDPARQRLIQTELPEEIRGKAIGKGPLPFLFNAKADDIKRRFWLRVITPKEAKGEYWLEAVPKTQDDAANFRMIHVIIDEADYLPEAMILFGNGDSGAKTTFQFNEREVNFSVLAEQLNLFHREFYEPKLPSGWQREVNRLGAAGPVAAQPPAPGSTPAAGTAPARR